MIVADDCTSFLEPLIGLRNRLKSLGKPADIFLVARTSDAPVAKVIASGVDVVGVVDDTVLEDEWSDFIDHFEDLGVINKELLTTNLQDFSINSSFFALMYVSVHGVQKPLKRIVTDEFNTLDAQSRQLYAIVSLLQSQLLTTPTSLALSSGRLGARAYILRLTSTRTSLRMVYSSTRTIAIWDLEHY